MKKWCLCIWAFFALSGALFAAAEKWPLDSVWRWSGGDDPDWANMDFDDSAWTTVSLPAKLHIQGTGSVFWIRTRYVIPVGTPDRMWFLSNTQNLAFDLYVNGIYMGSRGVIATETINTNYNVQSNYADAFLLPYGIMQGETVTFALRVAYRGSAVPVPLYHIGNMAAKDFLLKVINPLNGGLYEVVAVLCFMVGVCCLIGFTREEYAGRYLGISLFLIGFYLAVNGSPVPVFYWMRGISRWAVVAGILLWPPFFCAFLGVFKTRFLTPLCMGAAGLLLILLAVASSDDSILSWIFPTVVAGLMFCSIGGSAFIVWEAVRKGEKFALLIFCALIFDLICIAYDAAIYIAEQTGRGSAPLFYWQTGGILIFLFCMLIFIYSRLLKARDASKLMLEAASVPPIWTKEAGVSAAFAQKYKIAPKERQVINLVLEGKSDKEIAVIMQISVSTVRFYLKRVYSVTGISGRYALMAVCMGK
ncbi:MAG: helix-turn-helix transcriptional regulator [Treponema sp.]|jgi:DNA-binding CsgD family transcriptional regulator|nr:helix-turn-helix transcriptional regulator [Treponema sp.]